MSFTMCYMTPLIWMGGKWKIHKVHHGNVVINNVTVTTRVNDHIDFNSTNSYRNSVISNAWFNTKCIAISLFFNLTYSSSILLIWLEFFLLHLCLADVGKVIFTTTLFAGFSSSRTIRAFPIVTWTTTSIAQSSLGICWNILLFHSLYFVDSRCHFQIAHLIFDNLKISSNG